MPSRSCWFTATVAAIAMSAGCSIILARDIMPGSGSFQTLLKVNGPVELEIMTGSGHIHMRAGDVGTVRVAGEIRVHQESGDDAFERLAWLELNPPIEQVGNNIRIGRLRPGWSNNMSISYDLIVPPDTRLRSRTGAGEQSVDGIRGPVEAISRSGRLTLTHIGRDVQAHTGVGDILLDSVAGDVYAATSSGSIRGGGFGGAVLARTGVGHVRLDHRSRGDLEVVTSSGNVELNGAAGAVRVRTGVGHIAVAGDPAGEWNLAASSGNVTVRVPSEASLDLRARTSAGRISSRRPITIQSCMGSKEVRGTIGGGGRLLNLHTGVGNIRIE